ncbi:hypothetical protein F5141DRAFT_598428 [Pisolithus sp. B1]|nr:hypothetical protein F5141DRAFT_598428 [Pisolithus sp. B1]
MSKARASFHPPSFCWVMTDVSTALKWGPGFVGMSIGLAMYGVSVCQYLFYVMAFPRDRRLIKCVVLLVFVLDTINTVTSLSFCCRTLVLCRWTTTYACTLQLSWDLSTNLGSRFVVSFLVQCFYAHRVWMICGRSKLLTGIVLLVALAALVFGTLMLQDMYNTRDIGNLFTSPYSPANAMASTICDGLITTSIYLSLRRSRSGLQLRKENCVTKLNIIFIQMGMITFLSALTMTILSYQNKPAGEYFTAAPGFMLSKAYSGSMLAILNARNLVDNRQQISLVPPSEFPALATIR